MDDFRLVVNLTDVRRIPPRFASRPSNPAAKLGLQFERRIKRELDYLVSIGHLQAVEHNPWFSFNDHFGSGTCSPDFIIRVMGHVAVVEVKLTWVPVALQKLSGLYCPVVSFSEQQDVNGIVICRNLAPGAPKPSFALLPTLQEAGGVLHWPGNGHIPWC